MSETTDTDHERLVASLREQQESLQSQLTALENAAEFEGVNLQAVLSSLADELSRHGAVYPSDTQFLSRLKDGINNETAFNVQADLEELCAPRACLDSSDSISRHAIELYDSTEFGSEATQDEIRALILDGSRAGCLDNPTDVVQALRQFQSSVSSRDSVADNQLDISYSQSALSADIAAPSQVTVGDATFSVSIDGSEQIDTIRWYVGGAPAGEGDTLTYPFEYPGVYSIAVEITDENNRQEFLSEEITVKKQVETSVQGPSRVGVDDTVQYDLAGVDNHLNFRQVEWEVNGSVIGSGNSVEHSFSEDGTHTLRAVATTPDGFEYTASTDVNVTPATGVDISIGAPDEVLAGKPATFEADIETPNADLDHVTCHMDGEPIDVKSVPTVLIEHTFDKPGTHTVSVTATNDQGDSREESLDVMVHPEARAEIVAAPGEVAPGAEFHVEVESEMGLDYEWQVQNGELVDATRTTASIVAPKETGEVTVAVEVQNKLGDTAREEVVVGLKTPTIDATISGPNLVVAGEEAAFSVSQSTVRNTAIEEVTWTDNQDTVLGNGETLHHTFENNGTHELTATIEGVTGQANSATTECEVKPLSEATAVIVIEEGATTADTWELDGSQSAAEHSTIQTFAWEIDGQSYQGESVEVDFTDPGSYEAVLTIETAAGDSDTARRTLDVSASTSVRADLDAPVDVTVGDTVTFDASSSVATNTEVDSFRWRINGTTVDGDATIEETFDEPGHYAVEVTVRTDAGDEDTATASVDVQESRPAVEAAIEVPDTIVTHSETTLSADVTTSEGCEVEQHHWNLGGTSLSTKSPQTSFTFNEHGRQTIQLEVETVDGPTTSTTDTVFVERHHAYPPFEPPTPDSSPEDIAETAIELYQDTRLGVNKTEWFVGVLLEKAQEAGIEITSDELVERMQDMSGVDFEGFTPTGSTWEGDERSEGHRFTDETTAPDHDTEGGGPEEPPADTEASADATGSDQEAAFTSGEDPAETEVPQVSDDESQEEEGPHSESGGLFEDDGWTATSKATDQEETSIHSTTTESPDQGKDGTPATSSPVTSVEAEPESEQEQDTAVGTDHPTDPDSQQGGTTGKEQSTESPQGEVEPTSEAESMSERVGSKDNHIRTASSPEALEPSNGLLDVPNYVQDLVDIEFVFERDDALLPDEVNGAGIVRTDDDTYVAIARVDGRNWSILPTEKKVEIAKSYESVFLAALENHVQIISIPSRFDIEDHVQEVEDSKTGNPETPTQLLMDISRSMYTDWISGFIEENDMREREFYLVIELSAQQLREFKQSNTGLFAELADLPVIGGLAGRFQQSRVDDVTGYQVLRELNSRMDRALSNLRQIDVRAERISSRDAALEVLYKYYNDQDPRRGSFGATQFTRGARNSVEEEPRDSGGNSSRTSTHDPA